MNECCEHDGNLLVTVTEHQDTSLIVRVCQVCHRRHFEFILDKGEVYGKDEVDNG